MDGDLRPARRHNQAPSEVVDVSEVVVVVVAPSNATRRAMAGCVAWEPEQALSLRVYALPRHVVPVGIFCAMA